MRSTPRIRTVATRLAVLSALLSLAACAAGNRKPASIRTEVREAPVLRFVAIPAALTDASALAPPPWPQREGDLMLWGDLEARLLVLEGDGTPENVGILGSCVARLAEIERISGQVAAGESP